MTSLHRVVLEWSGRAVVGRAVTVLHFDGSNQSAPPVAALYTAFDAYKSHQLDQLTVTIPGTGDTINDTDGSLTGVWSATGGGTVTGGNASPAAAGVGACIGWSTGGIVNGSKGPRKLRGRTYIVPLPVDAYENNGTLGAGTLTNLTTLASAIMAAGPLAVWHRPSSPTATDGNSYAVLSAKVRDRVAFLSSRRD